ncbi:hypothetical protein [Salinibacter ruber]|uniref:hypothetical protein n=1 Tax=Salinibacter ruber TaxID=146919 RepID=UPI000E56B2F7|nr:hypothetical protein [Salinibacter ruber]
MLRFFSSVWSRSLLCLFLLAAVASTCGTAPALAQENGAPRDETLFGSVQSSGGYGAPTVALTTLNGETAAMVGGQGGWVLNRRFVVGGALRGIVPRPDVTLQGRSSSAPESAQVQLGYAGLLLEYIGASSNLLHYGGTLVVGGGNVELVGDQGFRAGPSVSDDSVERSAVFAAEVGARAELNVTRFFRIGLSGGYRLVSGAALEKAAVSDGDLSAPYGQLSLRFGSF